MATPYDDDDMDRYMEDENYGGGNLSPRAPTPEMDLDRHSEPDELPPANEVIQHQEKNMTTADDLQQTPPATETAPYQGTDPDELQLSIGRSPPLPDPYPKPIASFQDQFHPAEKANCKVNNENPSSNIENEIQNPDVDVPSNKKRKSQDMKNSHGKVQRGQGEDDDDIVIIEPRMASEAAQSRWSEPRVPTLRRPEDVEIKKETVDESSISRNHTSPEKKPTTKSEAQILAMLAIINDPQPAMEGARDSPNGDNEEIEMSDHERMDVDAAMGGGISEDVGWMDEEVEPVEESDEYTKLLATCNLLESKKRQGIMSYDEGYELSKAQARLKDLDIMRNAAQRRDDTPLFVEDSRRARSSSTPPEEDAFEIDDDQFGDHNGVTDGFYDSDTEFANRLHAGLAGEPVEELEVSPNPRTAKKSRKKAPKNTREAYQQKQEKEASKAKAKMQKQQEKASQKARITKRAKQKKNHNSRKGNTLMDQGLQNEFDFADLLKSDIIDDHHRNAAREHGSGPAILGSNKVNQIQQIFNNIPPPKDASEKRTILTDKKKLREAAQSFGYAKVRAVNGRWKVAGMSSPLYHHQLLGAHWMITRELSEGRPHGGLLADSMGLGKTIETIACITANPPPETDIVRGVQATLVVVPAGLVVQWHEEIIKHRESGHLKKILMYKSSKSNVSKEILESLDIVICSYQEVMKQFPFPDTQDMIDLARVHPGRWLTRSGEEAGLLHQINWYRVVLDEAHLIKNYYSKTSIACQNLKSIYRWCLTGTPLMNRIEEFYPYLHFLRANYTMDQQTFQKHFCDPSVIECRSRLGILLSYAMLRRTMKTTLLNRPLISLPDPKAIIEYVDFSDEERIIYRITENRFRDMINQYIAKHDLSKNYAHFFVQLLRLRQCTGHPFMMERTIKECWTLDDAQEARQKLNAMKSKATKPFYERTKLWVNGRSSNTSEDFENLFENESGNFGREDMGNSFSMRTALKSLKKVTLEKRVHCGICGDFPVAPFTTECKHTFCRSCLEEYIHRQTAEEDDVRATECPKCGSAIYDVHNEGNSEDDMEDAFDEDDDNEITDGPVSTKQKGRVPEWSLGRDAFGFEPHTNHSTWLQQSDRKDSKIPLTSSAKITALKALLLKAFEEQPLEKIVIYVQFRILARIVGRLCNQEKWPFLYYTGDCPPALRAKTITEFTTNPQIRILISGLKCGGLGLNLTMASRCVSLDLWWNHAVEQQAFGRIFRIGQEKNTVMTRLVVRNSVDMRLLSMQAHKLRDVERCLGDHGRRVEEGGTLGVRELVNLFGFLRTEGGEVVGVESDYDD
ncbi:P-loop containing nucleoside triphosphate hydrolase [Glarea lozoyensis ATCC 20868]|uniref:p-loop containing nucleoside triphosphate hydrolase n=1 Tax=Glarea lozoyensis (strain ATCC 20868 / MF5171) TaxID=1116229 RepID=S3CTS0_GLAL2|nr:P-loop containing nucleoside triphosphate hydrolase [Glarea lozoyensis ATCC 20868]EPE28424.1 P-loop containing nucleoside triphosphate hydrolase [Glarea lozoyensis ATCC 20868]